MLSVPYFEKALYELPEEDVTPANILKIADEIEMKIQGGLAARPLMSVPHIISDEASCYYHGYVLAEMSVYQTREFFLKKGPIVDNPNVGKTLTKEYWEAGNSVPFLTLVENLTGTPLTGKAWLSELAEPLEKVIAKEKADYEEAMRTLADAKDDDSEIDLKMRMIVKDGDTLIADSKLNGGFLPACNVFADYVKQRFYNVQNN